MKKNILMSGIQPTGNIHVGNYLGAVKNWVDLQASGEYRCFFSVVDYHSLTGGMSAEARREQRFVTAVELLALGIDPEKSVFYIQSDVPEVTELAWIFNTITPLAELERMTQFKDKSGDQRGNINAGLLTYPILQAADILFCHATRVPVGQDQVQHVELTRVIARAFNKRYGELFAEPEVLLTKTPKIKSLLAPEKKMSKSLGEGHVIDLADTPEMIEKKLKKAVTATGGGGKEPGVENLFALLYHFGDEGTYSELLAAEKSGSIRYGDLKKEVGIAIAGTFEDFRGKREKLMKSRKKVEEMLAAGGAEARAAAQKTMKEVRDRVGL